MTALVADTSRFDTVVGATRGVGLGPVRHGQFMAPVGPRPRTLRNALKPPRFIGVSGRQLVHTGVEAFDAQTNHVSNSIVNGHTCEVISIAAEDDCWPFASGQPPLAEGVRRDRNLAELAGAVARSGGPGELVPFVREASGYGIVTVVRLHHNEAGGDLTHAWLVVCSRTNRLLRCFFSGEHPQSRHILDVCAPYIATR